MSVFTDLSALAEPTRVRLLLVLEQEELGVGELIRVVQMPQSTVSRHLKVLSNAGWLIRRSVGASSLFRMDVLALEERSAQLWAVVKSDAELQGSAAEDNGRLQMVLSMRNPEKETFFGREAGSWEALRAEMFGLEYLLPVAMQLMRPNLVVADLGCGTGEWLLRLAPAAAKVIGIDREEAMLDLARVRTAQAQNVDLKTGGLDSLPLESQSVDLALCSLVLHHVPDLGAAFREIHRVLNETGRLIIVDMLAHQRHEYKTSMGHVHLGFERESLRELLGEAGIVVDYFAPLPLSPDAKGPGLFLVTARRWG